MEGSREFGRQLPVVLFVSGARVKSHRAAARRGCSFSTFLSRYYRCPSSFAAGGVESAAGRIRASDWDWWWKHWREARAEGDAGLNNQRRPATCRRLKCLKPSGVVPWEIIAAARCSSSCQCSTRRANVRQGCDVVRPGGHAPAEITVWSCGIHFMQLAVTCEVWYGRRAECSSSALGGLLGGGLWHE